MKPSSRRGRPRQTAAPGAPGRTPWCGDRRLVVGTNRRRVSGHSSRSRGSHQLGCPADRDDGRLAPPRERTGVLNRVKVALAALAADATLTRFPRAHRRAFIGASQKTDRSNQWTCVRTTDAGYRLTRRGLIEGLSEPPIGYRGKKVDWRVHIDHRHKRFLSFQEPSRNMRPCATNNSGNWKATPCPESG